MADIEHSEDLPPGSTVRYHGYEWTTIGPVHVGNVGLFSYEPGERVTCKRSRPGDRDVLEIVTVAKLEVLARPISVVTETKSC